MKNILFFLFFCISSVLFAQTDYSNSWEDFYSYNNVKDFVKVENTIYALVDNAVFIYDENTLEIKKLSSVQGLSGETTSAIFYSKEFQKLIIGYETGLIEIVDKNNNISISADIVNFNQFGDKTIQHIFEYNQKIYLSTPFAIVMYDIENEEFGDTFFIGSGSTSLNINQTIVFNDTIYAATENGLFRADFNNNNLIDFNNWQQFFNGQDLKEIIIFNNKLYTLIDTSLYEISGQNLLLQKNFFQEVISLRASTNILTVALKNEVSIFNSSLQEIQRIVAALPYNYTLNTASTENNTIFLGTKEYGILITTLNNLTDFTEIHPEGPLSNNVFSISAQNKHLWVVFGGYNDTYTPSQNRQGFSHFNGEKWLNTPYNPNNPIGDMVNVTLYPNNPNVAYISVYGDTSQINTMLTGGLLAVDNEEIIQFYNQQNSTLEDIVENIPNRVTIRVGGTAFDRDNSLWVSNIGVSKRLKKMTSNGQWSSYDISSILTNPNKFGLNEIAIDGNGSKWIGTRRNGVLVFNENGNQQKALITNKNQGDLPDLNVRTVTVDRNNTVWIGTLSGLVIYRNASGIFTDNRDAKPIVIGYLEEEGIGEKLLGDQTINTITIDGADNKWFGTDRGGVLYTNPSGQKTLALFNKTNSPLPSNRIFKIAVDTETGKVYFATDKGIVAYNSNVVPFGNEIPPVYAYPNPALKNHDFITIDGLNGKHLPKGTNVKIIDIAGNLVYETNVVEGQQLQGGKVIWNKTNLAGKKVASGVYIVLLTNDDASEKAFTKIAIVN